MIVAHGSTNLYFSSIPNALYLSIVTRVSSALELVEKPIIEQVEILHDVLWRGFL